MNKKNKVAIIGSGYVGTTSAYAIMQEGSANEIVLIDINKEKAQGEALDLAQGACFVKNVNIYAGEMSDLVGSDVIVIAAGIGQKPGETRLDILKKNEVVFKSIVQDILKYSPTSVILVVSNPVDILTYLTLKLSGLPKGQVIGSGTVLDTARLKHKLAQHFNVDPINVHAYIIGEHGDSEIATWSLAKIGAMDISNYCHNVCKDCPKDFKRDFMDKIASEVKNSAYEIIARKGYTNYAVGLAVSRIVQAILRDEHRILTVSTLLNGEYGLDDVCLSVPCRVTNKGVDLVYEVELTKKELSDFQSSALILKDAFKGI